MGDVDPVTDVVVVVVVMVVVIDVLWSVSKSDVRKQASFSSRNDRIWRGGGAARCPFLACLLLNELYVCTLIPNLPMSPQTHHSAVDETG